MTALRILLLLFSLLGVALFSALFVTSIINAGFVETVAKEIIRMRIEKKAHEKIDALDTKFLSGKAAGLIKKHQSEIETAKQQLRDNIPERLASIIGAMQNLDCECRRKVEKNIRSNISWRIASAAQAEEHLTAFIQTKYMEIAEKLTREFRIFTGTNAAIFSLFGLAVFIKRRADDLHFLPPAFVLLLAAGITAYLYLLKQNWLHTILFSDYVGFTYIGYLSLVFAFLCDILFNKAKLTTELLNALFQAIGSSLQTFPC